jgi:hypothetical protein
VRVAVGWQQGGWTEVVYAPTQCANDNSICCSPFRTAAKQDRVPLGGRQAEPKGPLTCLVPLGGRQVEPRWSNSAEVVCPSPVLLSQLLAVAKQDRVLNGDRHDHAKPDPRSSLAGWRSDAARFYMAPLQHPPSIAKQNRRVSLGGRCGRGKTGS